MKGLLGINLFNAVIKIICKKRENLSSDSFYYMQIYKRKSLCLDIISKVLEKCQILFFIKIQVISPV